MQLNKKLNKKKVATVGLKKVEYEKLRETIREANRTEYLLELKSEETLNETSWTWPSKEGGNTYKEYISGQTNSIVISTWQ